MESFLNPANILVAGFLGAPPVSRIKATIAGTDAAPVARFADQEIALPVLPGLQNAEGRDVVVGIRPEYCTISTQAEPGVVACDLDLVETLGSEALLHASVTAPAWADDHLMITDELLELSIHMHWPRA